MRLGLGGIDSIRTIGWLASEPPAEAEKLARGSDEFHVRLRISRDPFRDDADEADEHEEFKLTWDQIFSYLGPLMFDETSESNLLRKLQERIAFDKGMDDYYRVKIPDEDFQTIKVQLLALGLIQKSVKKRSLKDTATYWSLTPYGEHYLTILKAIPSDAAVLS